MALISLEDLEGLDDEQLDDDVTDRSEPMNEEEQDRMYAHWQAVGRTHQVSVPTEMRGPIQEMTRRNQSSEQEQVPFVTVSRHEKLGEVLYEERVYPEGKWACVSKGDTLYEQSISNAFMKLMRFICKENSTGRYLGMSVPIVNKVTMSEDGSNCVVFHEASRKYKRFLWDHNRGDNLASDQHSVGVVGKLWRFSSRSLHGGCL